MKPLILIAALAAVTAGCSPGADSKHEAAMPRRYAYPRFEAADTASTIARLGDLGLRLSRVAEFKPTADGWADVLYPPYGATLHLTYSRNTDAAAARRALDNRRERMTLNLGDAQGVLTEYTTPAAFECEEILAPEAQVTPLQFIAVDPEGRMLSGAIVLSAPASPDSIAPVLKALNDEVRRMLLHLTPVK